MVAIRRIEVEAVSRLYGTTAALRGVSTVFEPGPICFIEGPNGAGKSTLLGVIGTVIRATGGRVRYLPGTGGQNSVRSELGWVAHESRCYRELTGRQNVELAAALYGVDPREAWSRVSDYLGIERYAERAVSTLSRGQKQRIALGRALVHRPSVLLLDEPFSGLDEKGMARTEEILLDQAARGVLVIMVSHERGLAARLGGRRLVLVGGRLERDERA